MIRWCSYCQSFLGQAAPFDDFSVTHGLCVECDAKGREYLSAQVASGTKIASFYHEIRHAAISGRSLSVEDLLARGARLGLKDVDLCVGILQPILQEIGIQWSKGQVTIAQEHMFTALADAVVKRLKHAAAMKVAVTPAAMPAAIDALLVCADGNHHTVGVQIIEMAMTDLGLRTCSFVPGLPNQEILALVGQMRPRILGISLSLLEQIRHVEQIAQTIESDPRFAGVKIVVGGGGVNDHGSVLEKFRSIRIAPSDITLFKEWLRAEMVGTIRVA